MRRARTDRNGVPMADGRPLTDRRVVLMCRVSGSSETEPLWDFSLTASSKQS